MSSRLRRTPLAGSAVRQRVHLAGQLLADDAELARAFQTERSHLRVRVVTQFVRLVHLNTIQTSTVQTAVVYTDRTFLPSAAAIDTDSAGVSGLVHPCGC